MKRNLRPCSLFRPDSGHDRLRNPKASRRRASRRPLMASVGPLEAWWSKNARMSWRRRHRVRPRWATSSSPAGTPRRIESITAARSRLPRRRLGSPVGGDDLLIDHVGHLHGVVLIGVEHAGQAVMLAGREQLDSGARDASDRALTGRHVLKSPPNRATQGRDTRRNPPVIRHPPPRCLKKPTVSQQYCQYPLV